MARNICLRPCPPTTTIPSVALPFMGGAMKAQASLSLEGGCDGCEFVGSLLLQLNPFLGALGVPLCLLGCIGAVIKAVQAIPDSLGPPPDPTALVSAVANMVTKCACVLQVALPPPAGAICAFLKLVRDIVNALIEVIDCGIGLIEHLVTLNLKAAKLQMDDSPEVQAAGACLAAQVQALADQFHAKFEPVGSLFVVIQPIFDLLSAVVPPPFSVTIDDINAGFAAFSGGVSVGVPPGTVLTGLNNLRTVMNAAGQAFVTIAAVCP